MRFTSLLLFCELSIMVWFISPEINCYCEFQPVRLNSQLYIIRLVYFHSFNFVIKLGVHNQSVIGRTKAIVAITAKKIFVIHTCMKLLVGGQAKFVLQYTLYCHDECCFLLVVIKSISINIGIKKHTVNLIMIMAEYYFAFGITLFKVSNKQELFFNMWVNGWKLWQI